MSRIIIVVLFWLASVVFVTVLVFSHHSEDILCSHIHTTLSLRGSNFLISEEIKLSKPSHQKHFRRKVLEEGTGKFRGFGFDPTTFQKIELRPIVEADQVSFDVPIFGDTIIRLDVETSSNTSFTYLLTDCPSIESLIIKNNTSSLLSMSPIFQSSVNPLPNLFDLSDNGIQNLTTINLNHKFKGIRVSLQAPN
ncbi:MAG: hypothetical protein NZO16_01250 [Deltaproteobacteria bacterium]|nr:hypothetical protein [Deltaproteobacteria bacterium]